MAYTPHVWHASVTATAIVKARLPSVDRRRDVQRAAMIVILRKDVRVMDDLRWKVCTHNRRHVAPEVHENGSEMNPKCF
jgi:hypothetical protein